MLHKLFASQHQKSTHIYTHCTLKTQSKWVGCATAIKPFVGFHFESPQLICLLSVCFGGFVVFFSVTFNNSLLSASLLFYLCLFFSVLSIGLCKALKLVLGAGAKRFTVNNFLSRLWIVFTYDAYPRFDKRHPNSNTTFSLQLSFSSTNFLFVYNYVIVSLLLLHIHCETLNDSLRSVSAQYQPSTEILMNDKNISHRRTVGESKHNFA